MKPNIDTPEAKSDRRIKHLKKKIKALEIRINSIEAYIKAQNKNK